MKKLMSFFALCALPFASHAVIVDSSIAQYEVDYTYFSIDADSNVRIETFSSGPELVQFDPVMYLFSDDGFLDASDLVASDDDGGTPAAYFSNSLINEFLDAGNYIVAVGDYQLTEEEAIAGINSNDSAARYGSYQLLIEAESADVTVGVPEPSTLAILGLGLMGLAFSSRRRRAK